MNIALYELAAEHRALAERLSDMGLDDQTIIDTLESEQGALEVKAQNCAMVVRNLEVTAAAIKDAESQMAARRKTIENRTAHLKTYMLNCMKVAGIQKIDSPMLSISIRKSPPSVDIFEPGLVPVAYMTDPPPPPPQIDKALVKKAMQDGFDVPGCRLVQGEHLRIS